MFSRLTGGTQGTEQQTDRGIIQNHTGKVVIEFLDFFLIFWGCVFFSRLVQRHRLYAPMLLQDIPELCYQLRRQMIFCSLDQKVLFVVCVYGRVFFKQNFIPDRSVKVWDLQSCVELQTLNGHPNNVDVVKYCPVSRLLFSVSSAYVKVWDLRENPSQCVKTLW